MLRALHRRGLLSPLLVALALRLVLAAAFPIQPAWDGVVYAHIADRLAEGEGYTRFAIDPREPHESTAFYPIGWPAMLAPLRWLGAGRALDPIAQTAIGSMLVSIAGMLGRRAAGARAGRIAAWIAALAPGSVLLSLSWLAEPLFTLLVAAASLAIALARRSRRTRAIVLASAILGLAAHVRPIALAILVVLIALAARAWSVRSPRPNGRFAVIAARGWTRDALRSLALSVAIAGLVIAPWTVRNAFALGGLVPISSNGGVNLLIGTVGEGTYAPVPEAIDCHEPTELAQDRCRTRAALGRIAGAPLDALARASLKLVHTFGHESAPAQAWANALRLAEPASRARAERLALGATRLSWLALAGAALAGAALLARRRAAIMRAALFAPPLGIAIVHAITIGGDRYHAPAAASFAALAAVAVVAWRASPRAERKQQSGDYRGSVLVSSAGSGTSRIAVVPGER